MATESKTSIDSDSDQSLPSHRRSHSEPIKSSQIVVEKRSGSSSRGVATTHGTDQMIDRYGFLNPPDKNTLNETPVERRKRIWLESSRLRKWTKMLENFADYKRRKPAKVKRRIRKGVPDAVRGQVWMLVSNASVAKSRGRDVYFRFLLQPECPMEDIIIRDVTRTFPRHKLFRCQDGLGQNALTNVLRAYSLYNPEVGYCQGMGFITALMLCYMPEEDAFWMLVSLMSEYHMEGLFKPGLPAVQQCLFQFQSLLTTFFPRLAKHMNDENIHPTMYASQWFITAFSYNFPFEFVVRVWDIFLHEGYKIIFRIALSIMKVYKDDFIQLDFEGILAKFQALPHEINIDQIIETSLELKLKRSQLSDLAEEYQRRVEAGEPV